MNIPVTEFRNYFGFLSNMFPTPITLGGVTYTCSEAAFQAAKLQDKNKRHIFAGLTGKEAKALGRRITLRPDWETIKIDVMRWVVKEKFEQNPKLKLRLFRLIDNDLIEGNTWGDTFWGVCNGKGENWLGKILMEYRDSKYKEYLDSMPDLPGYIEVQKKDIPKQVKTVAKHIYYETVEAGYTITQFRWLKGKCYYAFEEWDEDPCGTKSHTIFLISEDGEDSAQFDIK